MVGGTIAVTTTGAIAATGTLSGTTAVQLSWESHHHTPAAVSGGPLTLSNGNVDLGGAANSASVTANLLVVHVQRGANQHPRRGDGFRRECPARDRHGGRDGCGHGDRKRSPPRPAPCRGRSGCRSSGATVNTVAISGGPLTVTGGDATLGRGGHQDRERDRDDDRRVHGDQRGDHEPRRCRAQCGDRDERCGVVW